MEGGGVILYRYALRAVGDVSATVRGDPASGNRIVLITGTQYDGIGEADAGCVIAIISGRCITGRVGVGRTATTDGHIGGATNDRRRSIGLGNGLITA